MKVKEINQLNSNIRTKGLKVFNPETKIPYTIENKTMGYRNGKLVMRYQLQSMGPFPETIEVSEKELREYDVLFDNE